MCNKPGDKNDVPIEEQSSHSDLYDELWEELTEEETSKITQRWNEIARILLNTIQGEEEPEDYINNKH